MADYIYTVHPIFPLIQEIAFDTEVIAQDSLFHASFGSPASFQSTCPAPRHPVQEITNRKTFVSDNINNPREQRRNPYETHELGYVLNWNNLVNAQISALINFFIARKGRFQNFNIQYSYLFGGANTLVRFNSDILRISLDSYGRFSVSVEIARSINGRYIPNWNNPRRKFSLIYDKSDLSDLKTFFQNTALGRYTNYTFDLSQLASNLSGSYNVRFNSDEYLERWEHDNQYLVEVELLQVI